MRAGSTLTTGPPVRRASSKTLASTPRAVPLTKTTPCSPSWPAMCWAAARLLSLARRAPTTAMAGPAEKSGQLPRTNKTAGGA